MKERIWFSCLLWLLFLQCVQKPTDFNNFIKSYSSFDEIGDVGYGRKYSCNGYIDIKYGSVSVYKNHVVCTLLVENLPDTLLFNNDSIKQWDTEYWWEFAFHNKIDTTQFVYIITGQYKRNNLPQWYGHILDYTFSSLAIYTRGKDDIIYYDHPVNFTKNGNTLIMTYYDQNNLGIAEHILNSSIIINTRCWVWGNTSPSHIEDQMKIAN